MFRCAVNIIPVIYRVLKRMRDFLLLTCTAECVRLSARRLQMKRDEGIFG